MEGRGGRNVRRATITGLLFSLAAATGMTGDGCLSPLIPGFGAPALAISARPHADDPLTVILSVDSGSVRDVHTINWSFGDGSRATNLAPAAGRTMTHHFPRVGEFDIEVFLFALNGEVQAQASRTIQVGSADVGGDVPEPDVNTNQTPDEPEPRPRVRLKTSLGDIVLELKSDVAPNSVANFLQYVDEGHYNGTVFHRVVSEFVIQGGGFETLGESADPRLRELEARDAILSEANNGCSNLRGTVAFALRGQNANSATDQFFINLDDNSSNLDTGPPPFTVFAEVVEGMDVVDQIAAVETGSANVEIANGQTTSFSDVPADDVVIQAAIRE